MGKRRRGSQGGRRGREDDKEEGGRSEREQELPKVTLTHLRPWMSSEAGCFLEGFHGVIWADAFKNSKRVE